MPAPDLPKRVGDPITHLLAVHRSGIWATAWQHAYERKLSSMPQWPFSYLALTSRKLMFVGSLVAKWVASSQALSSSPEMTLNLG